MSTPTDVRRPASLQAAFGMEPEQAALRDVVYSALAAFSPLAPVGPDVADRLWPTMVDLGLPGALVPEALGGAGLRYVDVVVALEQVGRLLLSSPLLATTIAVSALLDSRDEALCNRFLPDIATGRVTAAVAVAEHDDWAPETISTSARPSGAGYLITGRKDLVLHGHLADLLLVAARVDGELGFFAVVSSAPGLTKTPLAGLDQTRHLSDLRFDRVSAIRVGSGDQEHVVKGTLEVAQVLLAAEQIGAAQQLLDMSVAYARTRVQYGRTIGSFQAIKHLCADMLIELEYARAAAYYAGWAATSAREELPTLAGVLQATVAPAFVFAAKSAIQIHGALGFAWEHPAHLYYKRAVSDRVLFGAPEAAWARTARLLGL